VGAAQAERARVFHGEQVAGAAAASAGPVHERQDDDQVGRLALALGEAYWLGGRPARGRPPAPPPARPPPAPAPPAPPPARPAPAVPVGPARRVPAAVRRPGSEGGFR